jgi:MFS family permease
VPVFDVESEFECVSLPSKTVYFCISGLQISIIQQPTMPFNSQEQRTSESKPAKASNEQVLTTPTATSSRSSFEKGHQLEEKAQGADSGEINATDISENQTRESEPNTDVNTKYPKGLKLAVIIVSLQLACFCVALDNTIVATAIPKITDEFQALGDVGWYGSAYLLFVSSFQLFFGRLYSISNLKWTFIFSVLLFEIGSLVSAVAPTSIALIAGRAISGLGAAGVFTGALTILAGVVPLSKRALFTGLVSAVFGIASVVGPLLGGAFADKVTWRWCFYINLPIGGATILALSFFLDPPRSTLKQDRTWRDSILRFDPIGTVFFVPCIICLLLALQWGGTTYAWSSSRVIALFVVFAVLLVAFVAVQIWMGDNATLPLRIVKQRTIACAALYAFCVSGSFFVMAYYVPLWFQAVHGVSAVHSGINLLPLMVTIVLFIIIGGIGTTTLGYYNPFMFAPVTLGAAGAGLIYTWNVDTPASKWVGYQILFGVGVGLGIQQPMVAVQAALNSVDVPTGTALIVFAENFGGSIFVSAAQNIFTNKLASRVQHISGISPMQIVNTGATDLTSLTQDSAALGSIKIAYNDALSQAFLLAVILLCIAVLGAAGVQWKSIKAKSGEGKEGKEGKEGNERM